MNRQAITVLPFNKPNIYNEKRLIHTWLNTEVDEKNIIFDYVLDIFDEIMATLNNNKLELRYDQDTLLINLIYFLFFNSYTDIKF